MVTGQIAAQQQPSRYTMPPTAPVRRATRQRHDGDLTIGLLRQLDPERLIFYDGRRPDRADWERYCRQHSEYALVASRQSNANQTIIGTLEFRIREATDGRWGMIDRLYVDARHRRRGLASRLLAGAIKFAREQGLLLLRETIPNVLQCDQATGLWHPHVPKREGWGGLRSLGATAKACVHEHQPCAIVKPSGAGASCGPNDEAGERTIGAILELPIAPSVQARRPRARIAFAEAQLLTQLLADLARAADVRLAQPAHLDR